jgi:signal transduction histidine kinase
MARAFNDMAQELVRQRQTQMTFLAGIALDLRNPLAPLRTAVAVLAADDACKPTNSALLRVLERQVEHLDRLIGDLVEVGRIEAGRLDLRLEEVDARSLVEEAVELFRLAAPNITLQLRIPDSPVTLRCDPSRIRQVLNNLISNAVKYSRQGGQVAVSIHHGGSHVCFDVRDRGFGISKPDLKRLFEPFRRAKRAIDSPVAGEGLGLFGVRRIVEAHGGRLEVVSAEGEGSTFRVELPVSISDHAMMVPLKTAEA